MKDGKLQQLGKSLPEATLMFAKFSPDASRVAYVSRNNIYVESLDERQLAGAIGWLAREDKIIFNAPHDGKLANLSLMLNLYIG